jgi:hypothetical protein
MHRPSVGEAVDAAMAVVGDGGKAGFALGWTPKALKAAVPVYAVTSSGLGKLEIMVTYRECGCVIVNAEALSAWLRQHTGASDALLSIEPRYLFAYMLLHELGHLRLDDTLLEGSAAGENTRNDSLNRDATVQKERELRADAFAAQAIKAALAAGGTRGLAASKIAMNLSALAWNLSAHRILDHFGATVVGAPTIFWDFGRSHPNLEWRILSVNHMISGSDKSKLLLDEFEARRQTGPMQIYIVPAR